MRGVYVAIRVEIWLRLKLSGATRVARRAGSGLSCTGSVVDAARKHGGGQTVLRKVLITAAAGAAAVIAVSSVVAQQPGIKRTPLQTVDFPAGYNVVSAIVEIPPGTCAGRHTHPGVESTYVMEGSAVIKAAGQPDRPVKAGESFQIPAGVVHDGCTAGESVKILVTYVVEKGKPLATPAP
jgi:quercetin dioxygenase-like cupin family protein